jgi:2-polyprenyl-3-methyl-5-hydroxy-6-metoxy-1,4-benzoquinol methylase
VNESRVSSNRVIWNEMAALHEVTYFADDAVIRDETLAPFELAELGTLVGQRICHLQCHIAGNSLALANLGATVVGVDFSESAIEIARRRVADAGLTERVTFVCATVDDAPEHVDGDFDGVYTSWGVLCWLPDLDDWARTVGRLLRERGWLHLAEMHPYATALRWPRYPYGGAVAVFKDEQGDYSDPDAVFEHPESWEWSHGLGEIVTALATAGMRIEWLHEHPVSPWNLNDEANLQRRPDDLWERPGSTLPLSFTLRATKT